MRPKALTCAPQPRPLICEACNATTSGLVENPQESPALLTGFLCCLLSTGFFMLYRRWACKEASSVPLRSRCCYVPWPPDRQWAGWVSRSTIGRVGYCWRSRHLIEGWLSCSPPLTSLPPHVSRPGWYPAPLGSYSRQLRHTLKHGMDTEELTSHENKRLCAEPAGQDEGWPGPSQGRLIRNSL